MILVIITLHFHFQNCELELSYVLAELLSIFLEESCFLDSWKFFSVVPLFKNVGEMSTAKNYHSVSLLRLVNKFCEKHVIGFLMTWRNVVYFLVSSMVLGLLNQLQIFLQSYLKELPVSGF